MRICIWSVALALAVLCGPSLAQASSACTLIALPAGFDPSPSSPLAAGVTYARRIVLCEKDLDTSGPETVTMAHIVEVDLKTEGVSVETSSPYPGDRSCEGQGSCFQVSLPTSAVSDRPPAPGQAARSRDPAPQVAINANLFTTCCTANDPKAQTTLLGLEIESGVVNTPVRGNAGPSDSSATYASSLVIDRSGAASIATFKPGQTPSRDIVTAVTGSLLIVDAGRINVPSWPMLDADWKKVDPRTAVGLKDPSTLVMVVVDGKDGGLGGVTLYQLGEVLQQLGAKDAINLDGGGSSTMARRGGPNGFTVLSALDYDPSLEKGQTCTVPTGATKSCERYVGNVLAVIAPPSSR